MYSYNLFESVTYSVTKGPLDQVKGLLTYTQMKS